MEDKGSGSEDKFSSPFYDCETELIESLVKGENKEENDSEDTLPFEDTVLLENTVPLENTVLLENTVPLDTQFVGDHKNQEESGFLVKENSREDDAEDTVNVDDLQGDTEATTQLLEDFQQDNVISSLRNEADFHTVVDSDDEGGGETEVLSEDDDASDGRSSPRKVDELKHNQIPVDSVTFQTTCLAEETPQIHSRNTGRQTSFNNIDSCCQFEQKSVVDSDASTEDESDLGELQQHRGLDFNGCGQAINDRRNLAEGNFPQKSSQDNNQLDGSRVMLENSDPEKKNDSHKATLNLVSDDLNSPEAFQSVETSRQMEMGLMPTRVTRENSPDISSASVSRSRNIASIRAASLRATGLRALGMLSKTKEVTGAQGVENKAVGKCGSDAFLIPGMSEAVQAIKNNPIVPSDPKSRAESLTARRLFSDAKAMEVDKLDAGNGFELDDKPRSRNDKEEDDALGETDGNEDEQMEKVVNEEAVKSRAVAGNKEDAGSSAKFENEKDEILSKEAFNAVNSQQLKQTGLHELGLGKKQTPVCAGLSYLESQEPGDQSQADALNMVDKLVWLNTTGFSQDLDPQMLPAVTSCGPPSARGPQNLAQLVESINPNEKTGIFDWVDSQNDEGGGQFFGKNGRDVLASTKRGDKVKSESKQIGRRSSKSKNNSSVEHAQTEKIGKDKSKILLQGLQKLAGSSASKSNLKNASNLSHGRQNKVKEVKGPGANVTVSNRANKSQSAADTLRFSERLRSGEEQNHEKKLTDAADKKNALVEKMLLNSGEDSDQQERNSPTCRDSIDLHNIGIDTQLAAEAMQIMHSETSPNQATKENVHIVAESGCTKSKESRKGNRRVSGTGTHKASEDHTSRKRTLPDTDHESNENCAKQSKISRSSVATRGKSRGIHGAEDEGKLQKKDEGRKHGRPRKSKHDENEKLEANIDPIGSEARKENQDMVKDYRKVVRRKGSNMEETLKPAREVESTGKDTRVGRLTRQTRNLDQGEIREIETSLNSSRAGRKENRDMVKDSREVVMRKGSNMEETLQPAREVQSAGKDARVGRLTSQTRNLNKGEISQRETSPNSSGAGRKENQDMVKDSKKVVMRKGSNVEETLKPAREVQSAGKDTRVRCLTRQTRNLNQGEICETETSPNGSGAGEKGDILEVSAKIVKRKRQLAPNDPTKPSVEDQSVGEALEEMPNAGTPAIHSTRKINRKKVEKQKPAIQSNLKSPNTKEEDNDFLITSANIVRNKRKRANVEDTSYKQSNSVSTRRSSKSQPTKEVKSNGAHAEGTCPGAAVIAISPPQVKDLLQEENLKLDKQTVSQSPKTHNENRDTLPNFANTTRRKRSKTNKEESKLSKSILVEDSSLAEAADRDMLQKVGEKALRITRQSMRNSGPETSSPISALTTIDGDKPEINNMVPESGAQERKSWRRNTMLTTPSGSKLANHGSLARLSKVQPKNTSVDVKSPFTWQTPENVNSKSPATDGHGIETIHLSGKDVPKKGTPKSTLKRELDRLVATDSGQSPTAKDSARKRREPGSIRVLFSHSLDDDLVKQQKKILTRLGGQPTASPVDCTHFVTDKFVRTRNMLEAIAAGKPVVTHLWLESCGQASYFIDEKNYILRDEKKEKEIGFSMPASLASAQQKPLLQGKRVFVTPNTKPEQESIISLVKATNGQVLNGLKGAFSKKEENKESIIVISCEEDYGVCVPLLEKGARIYSSEFLLNGIVVQKLEFSRDQLFTDPVKQMRSSNMHLRQRT